jgi:HlyD family secretion protein
MALVLAVVGLGLYGLWPVITGQTEDEAAADDVETPPSAATVDAVVAERTRFPLRTQATGHLVPWQRASLKVEASGPVVDRAVQEGARVDSGDLIARLQNREERIALKEARAQLLTARAEYQARYDVGTDTGAGKRTPASGTSSASSGGETASTRKATQAAVSGLTAAQQAVERATLNLERTRITAPFAGRVANLQLDEGQYVSRGTEICTLLRDARMKVHVDVLESDLVNVGMGATARVHVPALGPPDDSTAVFAGTVWAINPQVRPESGTGRVTVSVPNPNRRLVAGLFANVELETERLQNRLVVPDEAVLVRQGRDLVFVVEGGRAQWTYVDVGARSGDFVEITTGVAPGDTVAVDGHFALAHDAPVEVDEVRPLEVK